MEEYRLSVQTSDKYLTAGTKSGVYIKITGENGASTGWHKLGRTSIFSETLKKGSIEDYDICHEGISVGPPLVITLKLAGLQLDIWLCDKIIITYKRRHYYFPVFDWVEHEEVLVTTGEATLPQSVTSKIVRSLREVEIEENKTKFQWLPCNNADDTAWGLNRHINANTFFDLPRLCRRTYGRLKSLGGSGLTVLLQTGANLLRGLFTKLRNLDDFRKLYQHLGYTDPYFIERWDTDEEMGRQVLTGISPIAFKRCTAIPEYCNITDDDVMGLLQEDKNLSLEMEVGRIYIADYTAYTIGVERNVDPGTGNAYVCTDCVGMFYAREDGKFIPIAIQLTPNNPESIFTPNDAEYDWLLAKMYFRSTMQSVHEWIFHFLYTHGMSETVAIATLRCFPRSHPLYKLLRPHLSTALTINTDARYLIFPEGSLANRSLLLGGNSALRHVYKSFHISDLDIPKTLEKNGTMDRELLPNYYYRDDAIDIWKVVEEYVEKILRFFYKKNEDIKGDFELQNWANDLALEGFAWFDGDARGVPEQIESVEELIHFCTIVIFTSSAQHAAVNFGQMETYQFLPNSPGAMRMPIHKKGEANLERIMSTLPGVTAASLLISFSYSLSEYTDDEVFLWDFPERLFIENDVIEIQHDFQKNLRNLNSKFKTRNKRVDHPYTYLLPEKIPSSIAI